MGKPKKILKDGPLTLPQRRKHRMILNELQQEWQDNNLIHMSMRSNVEGIRSSQISALIALLIRKGVL